MTSTQVSLELDALPRKTLGIEELSWPKGYIDRDGEEQRQGVEAI